MMARALDDRLTSLHAELVSRARAAQDQVFADASVDTVTLIASLKALADRLIAQLEATAKAGERIT